MKEDLDENEIRLLPWNEAIRTRPGMYISGVQDASVLYRECVDNNEDAVTSCETASTIIVDSNFNGYYLSADDGYGFPIKLSRDRKGATQVDVAVTAIHSGSKFTAKEKDSRGANGCGSAAINALSISFVVLSRVREDNYDKSIPAVFEAWNNLGPRQRKDLYYIVSYERGKKVYEGAHRLGDIEKMLFGSFPEYKEFPRDMSTITFFKPDPEIFESCNAKIPKKNLEYFTLIQEKFYKRKINVIINGEPLRDSIKPYQFEFTKTIIPADPSKNPQLQVYVTYEVVDDMGVNDITGSVNGLVNESGVHLNYVTQAYEAALKSEYKITHKYLQNGLRLLVILLASDVVFDSQTKVRLRNISKVKASDFQDVAKEFIKQFRKNSDLWEKHVATLDAYAESQKSFSAKERSMRMISSGRGVGFFKSRADLPKGFSDASSSNRLACELFLCIPGDEEVLLVNDRGEDYTLNFETLATIFSEGKDVDGYYTYATSSTGKSRKTKIVRCQKTRDTQEIVRITLTDGTIFRCTPNHKIFLIGGEKKEAQDLGPEDIIMFKEGLEKSNVKVSCIQWENLDSEIPVYCLEVQSRDHNFTLKSGVVVSNSEGLSSASSLVNGRHDTKYHAVMGLRGKILNISDKSEEQCLDNKEINAIFKLIGLGTSSGNVFDTCKTQEDVQRALEKYANYGKIVISSDADDDGLQIRNALVYTFAKMGGFLIDLGMIYYIESPIFEGDGIFYYPSDPIDPGTGFPVGLNPSKKFRRFKG